MNTPLVSVLLPIYKEPLDWISLSIESILQQTYTHFELILILDNPTDESLYLHTQQYTTHPKVQVLINPQNLGIAKALNRGLAIATGKYIARLDADDIALPKRLATQVAFMETNPNYALCGSQMKTIDETGNVTGQLMYPNDMQLMRQLVKYVNVIAHPSWFIRRAVLLELNGYRPFKFCEDYDFLQRLIEQKHQIANLPQTLVQHRIHTDSITSNHSLDSKVCYAYIQKMAKERKETGSDNFSETELKNLIERYQQQFSKRQKKAQQWLFQAKIHQKKKQYFRSCFLLLLSFCSSPIQRIYYIPWIQSRWVLFRYAILQGFTKKFIN